MWCCAIYRKDMKTFRDYISGVYIKIKKRNPKTLSFPFKVTPERLELSTQ